MIEFFLYVRKIHYITKKYKVVKVGITNNIYERECTYKQVNIFQDILVIYIK